VCGDMCVGNYNQLKGISNIQSLRHRNESFLKGIYVSHSFSDTLYKLFGFVKANIFNFDYSLKPFTLPLGVAFLLFLFIKAMT